MLDRIFKFTSWSMYFLLFVRQVQLSFRQKWLLHVKRLTQQGYYRFYFWQRQWIPFALQSLSPVWSASRLCGWGSESVCSSDGAAATQAASSLLSQAGYIFPIPGAGKWSCWKTWSKKCHHHLKYLTFLIVVNYSLDTVFNTVLVVLTWLTWKPA